MQGRGFNINIQSLYKISKTRDIKYHKKLKVSCKFQNA